MPQYMITQPQQNYLEILLNDCGFGERKQRNEYLTSEVGRPVRWLTDLTKDEASRIIEKLKNRRQADRPEADDNE